MLLDFVVPIINHEHYFFLAKYHPKNPSKRLLVMPGCKLPFISISFIILLHLKLRLQINNFCLMKFIRMTIRLLA
jgi:hypothetical protein